MSLIIRLVINLSFVTVVLHWSAIGVYHYTAELQILSGEI